MLLVHHEVPVNLIATESSLLQAHADQTEGRLGDMYGHKRIYLIGWIWFCVWSLISGFAYTSNNILFSICRAFQGIGKAFHFATSN